MLPLLPLPPLRIRDRVLSVPVLQGGMGIGISLAPLAGTIARHGGGGTLSSAAIDLMISREIGKKISTRDALITAIADSRAQSQRNGMIGVNIMRFIDRFYIDSIRGAVDGRADFIASGAGLPLELPKYTRDADIALIPIISSLRALMLICKRWDRYGRRPDAVIVEGPLAGGHLGFAYEDIINDRYKLEHIFPPIKEFARKNGDFPVIVAGAIDIDTIPLWIRSHGADGVQLGTRFLASHESGASIHFKNAVVRCSEKDIALAMPFNNSPGSPSGMPFRILTASPMFICNSDRKPVCTHGYVLQRNSDGHHTMCKAISCSQDHFCICDGLLAATTHKHSPHSKPLWTVGAHAHKITEILSVHEIFEQIKMSFSK